MASGSSPSGNCSKISSPIVFFPSTRYGSRRVDMSKDPRPFSDSLAEIPASRIVPGTGTTSAP